LTIRTHVQYVNERGNGTIEASALHYRQLTLIDCPVSSE